MRKILLMILAGTACLLNSCGQKVSNVLPITVFPDSIISDVSNHPVGVNLNLEVVSRRLKRMLQER